MVEKNKQMKVFLRKIYGRKLLQKSTPGIHLLRFYFCTQETLPINCVNNIFRLAFLCNVNQAMAFSCLNTCFLWQLLQVIMRSGKPRVHYICCPLLSLSITTGVTLVFSFLKLTKSFHLTSITSHTRGPFLCSLRSFLF